MGRLVREENAPRAGGETKNSDGDPVVVESALFLIEWLPLEWLLCKGGVCWGVVQIEEGRNWCGASY